MYILKYVLLPVFLSMLQISAIQSKAMFSKAEEEILSSIKSSSVLEMDRFESLLQNYPDVFHVGRTAKSLLCHWQQLKQYHLLPDQNVSTPTRQGVVTDFCEMEEQVRFIFFRLIKAES